MRRGRPMKPRDLQVIRGEERYPFGVGALVEALQSAGVATETAIDVVRDAEARLRERRLRKVELGRLLEMLAADVTRRGDPEAAQRLGRQTPPFVPILVETFQRGKAGERNGEVAPPAEEVPPLTQFSRLTLISSLEKIGLAFKESHAVATQVEQSIRADGLERLDQRELARRVAVVLEGRYGRDLVIRYEQQTFRPFELRVSDGDIDLPYSRGILAQSLMAIGLGPDISHNLARRVEEMLYQQDADVVRPEQVRDQVTVLLKQEAGEEFARRYKLMRDVRHAEKPVIVLIGGAPGVGKSAIAAEVGYRLGIYRIVSTDSIRQALRSLISPELSPVLHSSTFSAWRAELLPAERATARPRRQRVLRGYLAQVMQLGPALTAILERNITESTSLVMEGAHIVPGVAPELEPLDATVIQLVLYMPDADDHRRHFGAREGRAVLRLANAYLDNFNEIRVLQEYLREQAEHEGVVTVDASAFDRAVERCIDHILDALMTHQLQQEAPA